MALLNADGTVAETSGNGLRCAALALGRAGLVATQCTIETLAGPARCEIGPVGAGRAEVRVEMGEVRSVPAESPVATRVAWRVDVGNPHLVLIGPSGDVAIGDIGAALEWAVPSGQNVELVSVVDRAHLDLEVWERGAGLTEACGSGSVAAAGAAARAGLVDQRVVVANPGGTLVVELDGGEPPRATLTGPARHVATLVVEDDELEGERR
jgi:diaminopimelate epimerase